MVIIPAQIRAARALLGWSQEELAQAAEVGLSTVRDMEGMRRGTDVGAATAIKQVLENGGAVFLPASKDNGPGVCLIGNQPNIIRKPIKMTPYDYLPFTVEWHGQRVTTFIPSIVLDDFDSTAHRDDAAYVASFEKNIRAILRVTAEVIDTPSSRIAPDGKLHLSANDFAEVLAEQGPQSRGVSGFFAG